MALLMLFAAAVGVVQLAVLATWSRSVRITTLLQAIIVGALVCAPVTVAVQWALTRSVAAFGTTGLPYVVERASWTYDPVVEEILKVAPLVALALLLPRVHRQLGWTDHLMIGSALGTGFALAEAWLRYAVLRSWTAVYSAGFGVGDNGVQTVWARWPLAALTTWQPGPIDNGTGVLAIGHALWTALAAVGVAWAFRRRGWLRLFGVLPLVLASLSHAAYNAPGRSDFGKSWVAEAAMWVFLRMHDYLWLLVVALIAVDRVVIARAAARSPGLRLPGESKYALNPWPVLRAGFVGLPLSLPAAWQVVLQRRAAWYGLGAGLPDDSGSAAAAAVAQLGRATGAGWREAARQLDLPGLIGRLNWRSLLNWRVILWLVAIIPGLLFLVVGGWPGTRGLQEAMTGSVGTVLLVAGVAAGMAYALTRLPGLIRGLRRLPHPAWHEMRLRPLASSAIVTASVFTSVGLVARLFAAGRATAGIMGYYHVLETLADAAIALGLALMVAGILVFPPLIVLGGEGFAIAVTGGLIGSEVAGLGLVALGGLLSQAADSGAGAGPPPSGGSSSGGDGSGGGSSSGQSSGGSSSGDQSSGSQSSGSQSSGGQSSGSQSSGGQSSGGASSGGQSSTGTSSSGSGEATAPSDAYPERAIGWNIDDVREKIPEEWGDGKPNKKWDPDGPNPDDKAGIRWEDPADPKSNGVRIDKGDPNSPHESQQEDHVIVRSGGKVIGRDGNPINGSIEQDPVNAHVPRGEWVGWRAWNAPK